MRPVDDHQAKTAKPASVDKGDRCLEEATALGQEFGRRGLTFCTLAGHHSPRRPNLAQTQSPAL